MGRFFTSTQIYNPKLLDRDGFKADFCDKMAKEGYEVCEPECAELSYVLAFADNCKWVTISSEAYEQGNRTAQADTARIAKMLGTYCVNTIVIDSDCAMLNLYDDKGKKTDTAVMGRADDYLGDDIPALAKAVWEQLVSPDSKWEKFISVVQGDYVFVEDGLSELAPVIGMDGGNILFEYDDADESNENFCYLSFRKASSKKEKKLTLNAAFKQVFGEALEPLGFVKIKSKHPYFVRVINNEIIHIISYTNTRQKYHNKQPFTIIGGAFSVYRRNFNLDIKPYDNWDSLLDNHKIYSYSICEETYDLNYRKSICNFTCEIDNNDSIILTMKSSLEVTKNIMLAYLNKLDSIESYFKELVINNSFELLTESPEELIFFNIDNFEEITRTALNEKADMYKKCVELNRKGYTNENYENIMNNLENYVQEIFAPIKANISESASEYVKESEYNKKKNIEKLKSYGIPLE